MKGSEFNKMHSFTVCIVTIVSLFALASGQCPMACPLIYAPICGQLDDGTSETFSNSCAMRASLCESKKRVISSYTGECKNVPAPTCGRNCPRLYDPICAMLDDGTSQTFNNECEMKNALCRSKKRVISSHKGVCKAVLTADSCDLMCPKYIDPICVAYEDGTYETFSNPCEMGVALCKSNKRVADSYLGECRIPEVITNPCDLICPPIFDPICVQLVDGSFRTFNSDCELAAEQCKVNLRVVSSYKGECVASDPCNRMCPRHFEPYCGIFNDGSSQSFNNMCELEVGECKAKKPLLKSYKGTCSSIWSMMEKMKNFFCGL